MWSAGSGTIFSSTPERVGRDGELHLRFERRGPRTVLARCRSAVPLQVLTPLALPDPAAVVSILNPTGGLVGGDQLRVDVEVGPEAHACLTTPSATKVYRTAGAPARQEVTLHLGAGAVVEYVPDHTIPHAGSDFRQALRAEVGAGARLIVVDAFAAGRVARAEAWRFARLESALLVGDASGWLLWDRFVLGGSDAWDAIGLAEGAPYFATVAIFGDETGEALADVVGAVISACPGVRAAGGPLARRGAIIRCLAESAADLRDAVERLWTAARRRLLGYPPLTLRKL
jgi:urease accessory protein